ncbi:MAG: phospho-N-acetylmuramoyl-pentapeptide-transferase [Elusimicrobia bacterium]|nr:phospho-N-acetylmuramoyl-pentapeptide-transferase [Elusimicrobiota bacterium]
MLYHIFFPLRDIFSPFNLFQYITFRAGGAILTTLIISFIAGPYMIKKLISLNIGQTIRTDGPATHHAKSGTPTMGGVLILVSSVVSTLLWARLDNRFIVWLLIASVWLGVLGFYDDYLKLIKKNHRGVSGKFKLFWQIMLGVFVAVYLYFFPSNADYAMSLNIPYFKDLAINLSYVYFVLIIVVFVGSSNAVNLTDGLDGLAIGNIIIVAFTLAIFAYLIGHFHMANHLRVTHVAGAGEIAVFLIAVVGSGIGFLWYNCHPAEVFMGDTGSLFLGGVMGLSAIFIRQELILAILGGIFVIEALSVMIQVFHYRRSKKRFFKMAPIHHHYELSGISESKVTIRFWIVGIMLAIISIVSLKLR